MRVLIHSLGEFVGSLVPLEVDLFATPCNTTAQAVLQFMSTPRCVAGQRYVVSVIGIRLLRVPTPGSGSAYSPQVGGRCLQGLASGGLILADQTLVSSPYSVSGGASFSTVMSAGSIVLLGSRPACIRFGTELLFTSGLATNCHSLCAQGLSEEAAAMAAAGRGPSTLVLYHRRPRFFREWCVGRTVNPHSASFRPVFRFLIGGVSSRQGR